jgi:N-acetylmuramoyl-L-alanine amidase CwlA
MASPNIKKLITKYKYSNMSRNGKSDTPYIVIHGTGSTASAKNNATYYSRKDARDASAHFFVDDVDIYQSVEIEDAAWHCGGGIQGSSKGAHKYYGICKNSNSIGIEMCLSKDKKGNMYFSEKTLANVDSLVEYIISKYGDKVIIRHFDVTGKLCPWATKPLYGENNEIWDSLKKRLKSVDDTPSKPATQTPNAIKEVNYKVKITTSTLNIRNGAGVEYKDIGNFKKGDIVNIKQEKGAKDGGKWGNTGSGWINLAYTAKYVPKAPADKPVVTPAPSTDTSTTVSKTPKTNIKVGDFVKVTKLVDYSGKKLATFVAKNKYKVTQLNGERAVITKNGTIVAAVDVDNLKKV